MSSPTVLAVFAHPDDIEFMAAGTLLLLKQAGWEIHYLNLSSGNLGSTSEDGRTTAKVRLTEAQRAAEILGARFRKPFCDDLAIFYDRPTLAKLAACMREVSPRIVLTHSPSDYMEDHQNASRLTVTAAFARGMPNYATKPPKPPVGEDVAVYHALPHGLRNPLRKRVIPGLFVDTTSVHETKRRALAAHASQRDWLDVSQGMGSYLQSLDEMSVAIGKMSGQFAHAEGWRRHLHLGLSRQEIDPLVEALPDFCLINQRYEEELDSPFV